MRKLFKLKVIFLVFFSIFASQSIAVEPILPIPKPVVDKTTKEKTAKKKNIFPQKKPLEKKQEIEAVEKVTENKDDNITTLVYPKKKPIIVEVEKKIPKAIKKSEILSKKDFKLAKSIFEAIDNKKWQTALKLSKKSRDKTLYNLVNYLYLIKSSNSASFYEYSTFISNNQNFPRLNRLRYLAEHKINIKSNSPKSILKWFDGNVPLSDFGKIKLGEIYINQ